jgi:tetratricopeptide (TPR) repeat protein
MRQETLGRMHVMTAGSLMNLGIVQSKIGDYAAAKAHLQEALTIRQHYLPADDPHIGQCLLYLGQHAIEVGDIAGAMALLADSLAILQAKRPEDVETADVLISLAHCYVQQGQLAQTEACLQQAETIQSKRLAPMHLRTAYRRMISGDLAYAQGEIALARQHYEQARDIWQATAVPSHPDLLTVQQKLADLAAD